ncbi:MAG: hypothetical protein F4X99_16150 [Gammaproteobacteria bacterium]|nr:hypothetical protein [Gammaproteobacteria bacterium]
MVAGGGWTRGGGWRGARATAVDVRLDFGLDDDGRCRVRGSARLRAEVPCQRCAQTIRRTVEADVDLFVLASEAEARALTPGHDTCVVTDPRVPVAALIEDDLLLGFPEHGCEDRDACPHASLEAYRAPSPESGDGSSDARRDSPFAVLEGLAGGRDAGAG